MRKYSGIILSAVVIVFIGFSYFCIFQKSSVKLSVDDIVAMEIHGDKSVV